MNTGLANASGFYFKVVDSDDWLDPAAMFPLMVYLRSQLDAPVPCDMVVANYVYDKVDEGEQKVMGYGNVLPEGYEFGWDEVGTFLPSQYLLMHSVYYRTEMLRKMHLELPEHTFYVDNIFVYEPLVYVRTMRYFNVDAYHYFIGREDQSVNEKVMMGRMDQQLRVTRQMIDNVDPQAVRNRHLRHYLRNYLSMMMCICSVFLRMRGGETDEQDLKDIWAYLKEQNPSLYRRVRSNALNLATNLPTEAGEKIGKSIAFLINIFNPEQVIIGGSLANAGDYLMLPLKSAVNKYSLRLVYNDTLFRATTLDDSIGSLGAAMLIRNQIISL